MRLDDRRLASLSEHVIDGRSICPGAAFVEMALRAAHDLDSKNLHPCVENVGFHKLLFLPSNTEGEPRGSVLHLQYDAADSSFEIHSSSEPAAEEPTLHASGILSWATASQQLPCIEPAKIIERCPQTIDSDAYRSSLARVGYQFGETFRRITKVHAGDGEALGRVKLPGGVDRDAEVARLTSLDAAFQLMAIAGGVLGPASRGSERPVVPVGIERILQARPLPDEFWAYARVNEMTAEGLGGDAWLIDEDGHILALSEGLQLRALDAVGARTRDRIDDWLYDMRWEKRPAGPHPEPAAARLPEPSGLSDSMQLVLARLYEEHQRAAFYSTIEPQLNRLVDCCIESALRDLGAADDMNESQSSRDSFGIVAHQRRYFARMLEIHDAAGHPVGAVAPVMPTSPEALAAELAGLYPEYRAEIGLLERCGAKLPAMLRGEVDSVEVLFSGEALDQLSEFYHSSPTSSFYNTIVQQALAAALSDAPDQSVRVLEIGAGTGSTTASVLPPLRARLQEYVFTDISPFFLRQAERSFPNEPSLRFATLDIARDPELQGFEAGSFDLVIAANVLHATPDLRATLSNVRRLMAPGGLLMLLELTRRSPWLEMIFGLFEGWWQFEDVDLRPSSPLLAQDGWLATLSEAGFNDPVAFADPPREGGTQASTLMAAAPQGVRFNRTPDSADRRPKNWLILSDRLGLGSSVATELVEGGDSATVAYLGPTGRVLDRHEVELCREDVSEVARLIADMRAAGRPVDALIHVWSLDAPTAEAITSDEVMDWQTIACGSVLHALKSLDPEAELWLLTAGAQDVERERGQINVIQSPMWGLGRVLLTEYGGARCHIVDIGSPWSQAEVEGVAQILREGDDERELALRGSTSYMRVISRLDLSSVSAAENRIECTTTSDSFGIAIDAPGVLDSLCLRTMPVLSAEAVK